MTVHIKMLLKDGVSFRLLTAVDPVNIQVIASDPELSDLPVLSISNPPSKHVISNDAWIMNEKGDTISKIDYKSLTGVKVSRVDGKWAEHTHDRSSLKPITTAEELAELITGTPIFKPEPMEKQHRGAKYGAFIGMDFYPFNCIAPSLVREYGVYASDEVIEEMRKTHMVSHVFLSLLKANAEKYNPPLQTISYEDNKNKSIVINPPDSYKLFESILPPDSIDLLQEKLKENNNTVLVIAHSPGIIDNLLSSVHVITNENGNYSRTIHYPTLVTKPEEFSVVQMEQYLGNDEYTIFVVNYDEETVTLSLIPNMKGFVHGIPSSYHEQSAAARETFYNKNPELNLAINSAQMSVPEIVEAMRCSSLVISDKEIADVDNIAKKYSTQFKAYDLQNKLKFTNVISGNNGQYWAFKENGAWSHFLTITREQAIKHNFVVSWEDRAAFMKFMEIQINTTGSEKGEVSLTSLKEMVAKNCAVFDHYSHAFEGLNKPLSFLPIVFVEEHSCHYVLIGGALKRLNEVTLELVNEHLVFLRNPINSQLLEKELNESVGLSIIANTDLFNLVTASKKVEASPTPNTDTMRQALFDKLDNIPKGIADYLNEDSLWLFKTFVIEHVKGLLRADVRVTTALVNESCRSAVTVSTAQHKLELPPVFVNIQDVSYSPTVWSIHQTDGEFKFIQVEDN